MLIGIPRETGRHEHRVGLNPFGVSRLVSLGSEVVVERDAGADSHFTDRDYSEAGATIVYQPAEIYGRADLVCKVGPLSAEEVRMMRPGSASCGFLNLVIMPRDAVRTLAEREITVIGWESVESPSGAHPVLRAVSEIAGHMTIQWAANLLQFEPGGRGVVLGNIPGIAPPTFLVLGAGTVGSTAARTALANGAHVIVMDHDLGKLRRLLNEGCAQAVTAVTTPRNLERFVQFADVVIGAAMIPEGRAPWLVTEAMVRKMKPGSVIIDLAIDHGGCVETSRPTSLDNPTFRVHGVTHCCVPNITSNAPRTTSRALALACEPFLARIVGEGIEEALRSEPGLAHGVYMYRGRTVHTLAAQALGVEAEDLAALLGSRAG